MFTLLVIVRRTRPRRRRLDRLLGFTPPRTRKLARDRAGEVGQLALELGDGFEQPVGEQRLIA